MYYNEPLRQIPLKEFAFYNESAMQFFLLDNTELLCLEDLGFEDISIVGYEVAINAGGQNRRIDILAINDSTTIGVVELKNVELNGDHLNQHINYITHMEPLTENLGGPDSKMSKIGILVGPSISLELEDKIRRGIVVDGAPVCAIILQRFRNLDNRYYTINRVICSNPGKNNAYFTFNGNIYGVGRLVLAVIRKYVLDNPNITFKELQSVFRKSIHGSFELDVDTDNPPDRVHENYFVQENDKIKLKDNKSTYVTRQWGRPIIGNFFKKAKDLGYDIQ